MALYALELGGPAVERILSTVNLLYILFVGNEASVTGFEVHEVLDREFGRRGHASFQSAIARS